MSGGSGTTNQETAPWKPAQGALTDILGQASSLYSSGGFSADPYAGQRVADPSMATQSAWDRITGMAGQDSGLLSGASGTLQNLMSGDYQSQQLEAAKQNALGSAIPAAASMFSGSGLTDSSTAMDYVGRAASEAVAPIEFSAMQAAQDRALSAANAAPAAYAAGYLPAQMLSSVGAQQDALQQAQIEAEMAKYYEGQGQDMTGLQNYANLASMIGGLGGTTSGTQSENPGGLAKAGMLAQILGGGLSLFSDRRLKTDIRRIGETPGGANLYEYRYVWGGPMQVGVMADEVPHAIAKTVAGFAVVDYGKVS